MARLEKLIMPGESGSEIAPSGPPSPLKPEVSAGQPEMSASDKLAGHLAGLHPRDRIRYISNLPKEDQLGAFEASGLNSNFGAWGLFGGRKDQNEPKSGPESTPQAKFDQSLYEKVGSDRPLTPEEISALSKGTGLPEEAVKGWLAADREYLSGLYKDNTEVPKPIEASPVQGERVENEIDHVDSNGNDNEQNFFIENPQEQVPDWWPPDLGAWNELDPQNRIVEGAVLAMRYYYDLSNSERTANVGKFTSAYQDFAEYALGKKLYDGKDTRIIALELELVDFDKKEVQKYTRDLEKQQQLIEVLNRLDFLENEKQGIERGCKYYRITDQSTEDENPPHFSKEDWKKYLKRPKEITGELEEVIQVIIKITGQEFLSQRKTLKEKIQARIQELKKEKEEEKGLQIEVEDWEKYLERRLLQDAEIEDKAAFLSLDNPYANKSCEEMLKFIQAEEKKLVTEQDKNGLKQANKALEWNFYQAREFGVFDDLEGRLGRRYQELALSLFAKSSSEAGYGDMETQRGSRNLTLVEIQEIIAKESDEDNPNSFSNTAELQWRYLLKEGLLSREDIDQFKGLRKTFVIRAYNQMSDSLSNTYKRFKSEDLRSELRQQLDLGVITQQQFDKRVREIDKLRNIQRVSWEWDVRKYERLVTSRIDAAERAEQGKLFYVDRYYLTLTGTNIEEVEKGVNNYLKSLLEGSHVYDVQTILQKLTYLTSAIFSTKDVLMKYGIPETKIDEALAKIALFAENRGDFYVMNYAAQNLLMDDVFIPLYEKWAGVEGIKKLVTTLDMNNGLVAPAMLLFLDKKNQLLWQPHGFRGQGMNNIWAQRILRAKIQEQLAEELVNYQTRNADSTELMEQTSWQDFLRMKFTDRKIPIADAEGDVKKYKPKEAIAIFKERYFTESNRVKQLYYAGTATKEDLDSLRRARADYTKLQEAYDRWLVETKSAVETTMRIFNIFGQTAFLGAPSIIMDNGDHISIEDETYIYKFVILDAMRKYRDTPAMMRWRGYQWTKGPWLYDSNGDPILRKKVNNQEMEFKLVKGLEDIGITPEVYQAWRKAVVSLRDNGYNASFESLYEKDLEGKQMVYSFEDIVKRNDVKPVQNNFIGNYKSARDIFINPTALREAKKGKQPFIMKILQRLDHSGRGKFTDLDRAKVDGKPIQKVAPERLKEIFEDAVTDSFTLHILVRQLARWEASYQSFNDGKGKIAYTDKFSTDRLYYGGNEFPWGVKRLQYLPEYWMTNKRERIGRAWELLPFLPLFKSGLAQECDAENLPDLIWTVNKEHIDEPGLKQIAAGYKDAQGWRQRGETSVDEQRGETNWSYWDKLTVDSAQMLKHLPKLPPVDQNSMVALDMLDYLEASNPADFIKKYSLFPATKKDLVDVTREVLKRSAPLNVFLEAQLGYNRSAGGSGMGLEFGERMNYRYVLWLLSGKKGSRQEEGGLKVNEDAETFLRFVAIKNSWSDGMSILDEAWRQTRGTRDAGASDNFPQTVITA